MINPMIMITIATTITIDIGEYKNVRTNMKTEMSYPVCDGKRHGLGQRVWGNGNQYRG